MRTLALLLALAAAAPAAADGALQPVALESLRTQLETPAPILFTARGLEIAVDGNTTVSLPLRAQLLELDVEATGPMMLTWTVRSAERPFRPFGPPWRHVTLPRTRARVPLDLRIVDQWIPSAKPMLGLTGVGRVVIHGIRVLPLETELDATRAALDHALLWAPETIGHTTINLLTTPYWSFTREIHLTTVVVGAGVVAGAAWLLIAARRRRRARPEVAVALGALVALALWDLHFLMRFVPMLHLAPTPDVEVRIRDHYDVGPEVGALAALARATLRPNERVGTMGPPGGWFAPQTVCFNLAPRPCVIVKPGERVHTGISGVGRLRDDELDAIVAHRIAQVPEGFVEVAALGPSAWIARRRR